MQHHYLNTSGYHTQGHSLLFNYAGMDTYSHHDFYDCSNADHIAESESMGSHGSDAISGVIDVAGFKGDKTDGVAVVKLMGLLTVDTVMGLSVVRRIPMERRMTLSFRSSKTFNVFLLGLMFLLNYVSVISAKIRRSSNS